MPEFTPRGCAFNRTRQVFLATTLEASGSYGEARTVYADLIRLHPDSAEGHLGLGVLLVKLGGRLTEEGIKELVKAISLNGDAVRPSGPLDKSRVEVQRKPPVSFRSGST